MYLYIPVYSWGLGIQTIEKGKSLLSMDKNGARPSANFLYIGEFFLLYRKPTLNGTFPLRHSYRGPTEHTTYIPVHACTPGAQAAVFHHPLKGNLASNCLVELFEKKIVCLFVEFAATFRANSYVHISMQLPILSFVI